MSKQPTIDNEIKQQVSQYIFDIRKQVAKKAYWNATKLTHELFELLEKQPYVEVDNPPLERNR